MKLLIKPKDSTNALKKTIWTGFSTSNFKVKLQGQQEIDDCELVGTAVQPDFEHLNPEFLGIQDESGCIKKRFKPIEIDEKKVLLAK